MMNTVKSILVAIYVRVSLDIQVDGYSIDEQLDRLRKFCEAHGWTIYKEYVDPGYSGANIDRPGMLDLLKDVRNKKIDTVLVYKLDRLSRSQKDTLYLIEDEFLKNGVDFISMSENFDTSTPFGKAMIGILSVFAQLEREQIKERLAMGRVGRAKSGKWRGGSNVPIGYDYVDGELVINEYEAIQIRKIFELFLSGESLYSIAAYMHSHYTNKYSSWADSRSISDTIKNRLYIGKIQHRGQEYEGSHTPIIDLETFERVARRYAEISTTNDHLYRSPFKGAHLLSGLLFCGSCGARYFCWTTRPTKKDENGKQLKTFGSYAYYKCYTRDGSKKMRKADHCDNPSYRVDYLDRVILDEIKKLKLDPEYLETLTDTPSRRNVNSEVEILRKTLAETDNQIGKLMDLYTLGTIPIEAIGERIRPLYEKKQKLEEDIAQIIENSKEPDEISIDETRRILDSFDILDALDLHTQREIVQSLIKRIEIGHDRETITIYWKFT